MPNETAFNPLDKSNLGKSVVEALLESEESSLGRVGEFTGAGVYAIYYRGNFEHYAPLAALNKSGGVHPIYVGKAIPKGGRKGASMDVSTSSKALCKRLQEHAATIDAVKSLKLDDFTYRRLLVDDVWISLGESLVIHKFQPLWNNVVEGFGNHDPGGGRYKGRRPLWDELHPGRRWAAKCTAPKLTKAQIISAVAAYMNALQEEPPQV